MALEDELKALTAALNRNSDLLEGLTAKAKANVDKVATKPKAEEPEEELAPKRTAKAEEAPVKRRAAMDEEEAAPPKRTRAASAKAEPKKKPITEAEMIEIVTKFGDVESDEEYDARRDFIKKVVAKFDVKSMRQIPEDQRQKAVDMLEAFKAGDNPFEGEDE